MDTDAFNASSSEEEIESCNHWQPGFKGNIDHLVKLYRVLRYTDIRSNERRNALVVWEQYNKQRKDWDEVNVGGKIMVAKTSYRETVIGLDLRGLVLTGEIVGPISFHGADLRGSRFANAILPGADFTDARLAGSRFAADEENYLAPAWLLRTDFSGADIADCDFSGVMLADSLFRRCTANSGTRFDGADLQGVNFNNADLSGASLRAANLQLAQLQETDLRGTDLSGSDVYGATVISPLTDAGTKQSDLRVTPVAPQMQVNRGKRIHIVSPPGPVPSFCTNSLEHANLLHLMRNTDLAGLFGAVTQKGVLLLGRFADEHGAVLDALREDLRERGYLPMKFDFEKPGDRTLKETVLTLAGLSHFVIADITEASSIPLELATIAREFRIPIVPIRRAGRTTFSMFESFARDYREQVLDPLEYIDIGDLLRVVDAAIIQPAEIRAREIIGIKSLPLKVRRTGDF